MAAIILAVLGGGNQARNFNTVAGGESYGPQPFIAEHDPDLAPAPFFLPPIAVAVAQIEATPTPAAIAVPTVTAAASTPALSSPASGLENCPPLIVETFGAVSEQLAWEACAISLCETAGTWSAASHNTAGEDSRGPFQLNVAWSGPSGPYGWASWYGIDPDALFDFDTNVRVALDVRLHIGRWGGSSGWQRCAALWGIW